MFDYKTAEIKIEEEYNRYREGAAGSREALYDLLESYLKRFLLGKFRGNEIFGRIEVVEDVVHDCLANLIASGIDKYEPKGSLFAKWCCVVVKNAMFDHIRKYERETLVSSDNGQAEMTDVGSLVGDINRYKDPQKILVELEYKLERCEQLKKALQLLLTAEVEPYQTVGNCFTLVLYHKYNPESKRNSSPAWGYSQLKESSVESGAERFMEEMQSWMPHISLAWSNDFWDQMDEMKDGAYIGQIVFGEHFKVKDFENWCSRARKGICIKLVEWDSASDMELR